MLTADPRNEAHDSALQMGRDSRHRLVGRTNIPRWSRRLIYNWWGGKVRDIGMASLLANQRRQSLPEAPRAGGPSLARARL